MIKKIEQKNILSLAKAMVVSVAFLPYLVLAVWTPGDSILPDCGGPCKFNDAITLLNNLMGVMAWLGISVSVFVFMWIGWEFMSEGDNPSVRGRAWGRLKTLFWGLFLVLGAWLIVDLITSTLGVTY